MRGFDSFDYFADLFAICVIVVPLYYLLPRPWARRWCLALTGLYLLFSIAPRLALFYLLFWAAVAIVQQVVARTGDRRVGTAVLLAGVGVCLAPMLIWKLTPADFTIWFNVFLADRLFDVSGGLGSLDAVRLILFPIGLSYAAFRAADLLIQSNLGLIGPLSPDRVMSYGLFPTVQVIGPVIEYREIESVSNVAVRPALEDYRVAFTQVVVGAIKVFVLAVPLAASGDVFLFYETNAAIVIWIQLSLYAWFFYFNFSGYSDLAIGVSRLFGFALKPNFSRPYTRTNPQDFWNNWHMSLTRFAQRNVFIPMGGMRSGRQYVAIVATIMVIALWHDVSLALVLFGLYHVAGLVGNRLLVEHRPPTPEPSWILLTGKAVALFLFVAASLPMLALEVGELDNFYLAMIGLGA
jgi:alginate O-acetyltransferase complex protein AlgI